MFGCKSGFPTPIAAVVWNSLTMPNIKDNLLSALIPACGLFFKRNKIRKVHAVPVLDSRWRHFKWKFSPVGKNAVTYNLVLLDSSCDFLNAWNTILRHTRPIPTQILKKNIKMMPVFNMSHSVLHIFFSNFVLSLLTEKNINMSELTQTFFQNHCRLFQEYSIPVRACA